MAYLKLTQGYFATVDDEDFGRLSQFKWHIHRHSKRDGIYASRTYRSAQHSHGNRKLEYEVLNIPQPLPKGFCVDHINRNPLDCRKINLRLATIQQNCLNKATCRLNKTSIYKGVSYKINRNRWAVQLQSNYKNHSLGWFKNEALAMHAYNLGAIEHHGEFAFLNHWRGPTPGHPDPYKEKIYAWLKTKIPDFKPPEFHTTRVIHQPAGIQLLLPFE